MVNDPVDGRNSANQLRLVVYPVICKVLYIHKVVVQLCRISEPSTVSASLLKLGTQKTLRLNESFLSRVGLTSDSESKSS